VSSESTDTIVLFPGALGDFLCLWPALQALAASTAERIRVFAKPAWLPLLDARHFDSSSVDRREIADLFAAGGLKKETRLLFDGARVHSWTGHGDEHFAERLALASGGATYVHRFRGMADGEHASEYFARCLGVPATFRPLVLPPEAQQWADDFWIRHALGSRTLVLHSGSGSAKKNWQGMPDVARLWRAEPDGKVLLLAGPAEENSTGALPFDALVRNERLDRVAALLRRARLYLGNDSGVSHLAGLASVRGVVLFGPSDPRTWRPLGNGLQVLHSPDPCPACGPDHFCTHRATLERVSSALARVDAEADDQPTNV
jgi:ADP-heptose:LPS heptosyltransferase